MIVHLPLSAKPSSVPDLREAVKLFVAVREFHGIGASDLRKLDGQVFDKGKHIATISYNGRAWDPSGNEIILSQG